MRIKASLLDFLAELAANNHRDWFSENKARYEALVQQPALALIEGLAPGLARIAPRFAAEAKKSGGSLMRVYRDTRFSKDKTPYKTNVGIHFRHLPGKDVHAPGYYIHLAPEGSFLGVGLWRPPSPALAAIRARIDGEQRRWAALRDAPAFAGHWRLEGDRLARPPKGYPADHPLIDDLKRKDFCGVRTLSRRAVQSAGLVDDVLERFAAAHGLMRFLCEAVGVGF